MKTIPLKSLVASGALALSSQAALAQQTAGVPLAGRVINLLGTIGQNLGTNAGVGALSANTVGIGQGALAGSLGNLGQGALPNLGQGALAGNLGNSLNGSFNGLLSNGGGMRTTALALQGVGNVGGGSITINALNGNTRLIRSGNAGSVP